MIIYVTGFTASGKSTIGKELAQLLNIQFIDLDERVEQVLGTDIASFFKEHGEAAFRKIEREVLLKLPKEINEDSLVALGGGSMCSDSNAEFLLHTGVVLYLHRPLEYFLENLDFLMEHRPLFQGLNPNKARSKLINIYHHRSQYYSLSQLKTPVNTSFSAKKVANWLKLLTNRSQSL